MTATPVPPTGNMSDVPIHSPSERARARAAADTELRHNSRLRRLFGFDLRRITLDETRHAQLRESCEREVREQIGPDGSKYLPQLLQQATDDYQEQDRRTERAERRAASIQAAVATLLGLTTAGGGLLISSGAAKDVTHRIALATLVVFIIITLILTAVHALAVQATQHDWARPNARRYVAARAALDRDFEIETIAAMMAASHHNSMISDWKFDQMRHTANAFRVALISLIVVPVGLVLISLIKGG